MLFARATLRTASGAPRFLATLPPSSSLPPQQRPESDRSALLPGPVRRLKLALAQCPQEALISLIALDMASIYGTYTAINLAGLSFSSEVGRSESSCGNF
jgi:hypothetical protein